MQMYCTRALAWDTRIFTAAASMISEMEYFGYPYRLGSTWFVSGMGPSRIQTRECIEIMRPRTLSKVLSDLRASTTGDEHPTDRLHRTPRLRLGSMADIGELIVR